MILTKQTTFRNLLIGAVIILLLLVFKDWIRGAIIEGLGGYTSKETKTITKVEIQRDTVKVEAVKRKLQADSPVKVEFDLTAYENLLKKYEKELAKAKEKPEAKDSIYNYKTKVKDTLIQGEIVTYIDGKTATILDQYLDYKPLYPIIVKETKTITKNTTNTLTNERSKLGIGLEASTIETIGIKGVFQTKDNWQFQVGYNKALNNNLIWRDNPVNTFGTVTIIKTF